MHNCFHAADILLPEKVSMKKWACVACDQFSSQPEYWNQVEQFVGNAPSTLHLIIPEAYLKQGKTEGRLERIHQTMDQYLQAKLFRTYRRSFIYLERTMEDGSVRHGLVGQIDLEEYDFNPASGAKIRATEGTVRERIPPRMKLLEGAKLEFPHVLLLCDDKQDRIMEAARIAKGDLAYDFDLMEDGGHITGWIVSGLGVGIVNSAVSNYILETAQAQHGQSPMAFAVGDGNHSLASAKACWDALKPTLSPAEQLEHPARYALVELENIHDPAITFAPIHRVLKGISLSAVEAELAKISGPNGYPIILVAEGTEKTVYLDRSLSPLAAGILQPLLDRLLEEHGGSIDYIHGEDVVRSLASEPEMVGLILPGMEKDSLFPGVLQGGVLPRKTFSMGHAREKRYYLEGKMRQ